MLTADCPFRCNSSHQILDRGLAKLTPCPHCVKIARSRVSSDESLPAELGFPSSFGYSGSLDVDSLLPSSELPYIEEDSLRVVQQTAQELWTTFSQSQLPSRSLCFGLGIKGRIHHLAYPLLSSAFGAGLTVAPLASVSEVTWWKLHDDFEHYGPLLTAQVVVLVVEEGATREGLQVGKGLMQTRSFKGLPTVFITSWSFNSVATLVDTANDSGHSLAKPVFVEYKGSDREDKYSSYSMGILGVANSI